MLKQAEHLPLETAIVLAEMKVLAAFERLDLRTPRCQPISKKMKKMLEQHVQVNTVKHLLIGKFVRSCYSLRLPHTIVLFRKQLP